LFCFVGTCSFCNVHLEADIIEGLAYRFVDRTDFEKGALK